MGLLVSQLASMSTAQALFSNACNAEIAKYKAAVYDYTDQSPGIEAEINAMWEAHLGPGQETIRIHRDNLKLQIEKRDQLLDKADAALMAAIELVKCASHEPHQ